MIVIHWQSNQRPGCEPAGARWRRAPRSLSLAVTVVVALQMLWSSAVQAEVAFTAKAALDWCAQQGAIDYVGFGLPDRAAAWPFEKLEPERVHQWLTDKLGCDSVHYDRLWLVSGQPPRRLPAYAADKDEWTEWICRELLRLKKADVVSSTAALVSETEAEQARLVERMRPQMPKVAAGEAALVPLRLPRAEAGALFEVVLRQEAVSAVGWLRRSQLRMADQWALQREPGRMGLLLRDPTEPPQLRITLGSLRPEKASEWIEQTLRRPWGLFWRHWAPPKAKRWAALLQRPVSLTTAGSLQEVASQLSEKLGTSISVSAPAETKSAPVVVHLHEAPFWLVLHALSAVSGAQWQPWHDAASYELAIGDDLASQWYAQFLSVEGRMLWLLQEAQGEDLAPLWLESLTPEHHEQLLRSELVPIGQLAKAERTAVERFGLMPARVSWMRTAVQGCQRVLASDALQVIVVGFAEGEPVVFVRTGEGAPWRRYTGSDAKPSPDAKLPLPVHLPVPVFDRDRERSFAFLLQEYGDEKGIPPRRVFGPRSKPEELRVPRFVRGTVASAIPKAVVYGRDLGERVPDEEPKVQ